MQELYRKKYVFMLENNVPHVNFNSNTLVFLFVYKCIMFIYLFIYFT